MRLLRATSLLLAAASSTALAQQRGAPAARPTAAPLRFELLGPAEGGRIAAISGVPGDSKTWYIGAASGGVWKSTDSGATFRPVFDSMPVQAIGALAVAPSNHADVWAGTGEAWAIRDADLFGDGVYLSADSGATWKHMGLDQTGRIQRIIVDPTDSKIVYVCALGRATGPQRERGVFRTTDGGKTWKQVLFVDENTGCSGLSIDPQNPRTLFAGAWQVVMHTWAMFSGGPSSGIYVTHDGGDTWTHVEAAGLPKGPLGKIDVAIAPTNGKRVYALIQTVDQGSVWRSDDGGSTWNVVNHQRALIGRAGYYINIKVSTGNADEILVANSSFFQSKDGGKSFNEVPWGGDNHDIWIDPLNPERFGLTNDLGARLTTTHGKAWTNVTLPIAQMYHVAVDDQTPYWVYGNRQDNGTMRGPSYAPEAGGNVARGPATRGIGEQPATRRLGDSTGAAGDSARRRAENAESPNAESPDAGTFAFREGFASWDRPLGGCESGFTLPDVTDPNIVWASCYGNEVTRYDHRTKRARSVSPWIHTLDSPPDSLKYRCHWTAPLAIDPFDHNTVYYGCQVVFKTSNGGQHWDVISPDLSTRDPKYVVSSGGLVPDNLGQFYGEVVFAIAPSEIARGLVWAGTNDGKVWYTRAGGGSWTDVTPGLTAAGMPSWGTVRKIEPSRFDPATAYVAVDFHMMDNREPYIYKTTDFGKSWKNITGDLPATSPLDYVMAVTENPNRKGMLFAGTGHGFYYSLDDGSHWAPFNDGLPHTAVSWIVVPKKWHDVVVATYGRGVFILRDITPLEQMGGVQLASRTGGATLYPPHAGYRQARSGRAEITFRLDTAAARPAKVEILDSTNAVVRTMAGMTRTGYNRVTWDLHYDAPKVVAMRTPAPDNPYIFDEPRFKNKDTRPVTHWGIQGAQVTGPVAVPGRYAVRLIVNGDTATQRLTILKDTTIGATAAELAASTRAQVKVRDDIDSTVDMINKLEIMRKQALDDRKTAGDNSDVVNAVSALEKKMFDVELKLLSRSDMESDDKYFVEPFSVYMGLVWLNGTVGNGAGDVAGGSDDAPTDAALAWTKDIEAKLAAAKAAYRSLLDNDLAGFNRAMGGKVQPITGSLTPVIP